MCVSVCSERQNRAGALDSLIYKAVHGLSNLWTGIAENYVDWDGSAEPAWEVPTRILVTPPSDIGANGALKRSKTPAHYSFVTSPSSSSRSNDKPMWEDVLTALINYSKNNKSKCQHY